MIIDLVFIVLSVIIKGVSVVVKNSEIAISACDKLSKRYLDVDEMPKYHEKNT